MVKTSHVYLFYPRTCSWSEEVCVCVCEGGVAKLILFPFFSLGMRHKLEPSSHWLEIQNMCCYSLLTMTCILGHFTEKCLLRTSPSFALADLNCRQSGGRGGSVQNKSAACCLFFSVQLLLQKGRQCRTNQKY